MDPKYPWKARLCVALAMLALAFLGMVVTDVRSTGGWDYWKWAVPIFALLALWLSWYVRRTSDTVKLITLGHELLHWIGLILSVFLVSFFVHIGTVSRINAGLFDLTLLSLAVFLAGIYIERTFLFIGLLLAAFAMISAVVVQYLYALIVPIIIAAAIIVGLIVWLSHRQSKKQ